ncbi:heme-responsive histidine kinase [Corynebacterium diphtheriae]|nr:heme-responsive histidine kinase [Corynebacterium diphtheriae]
MLASVKPHVIQILTVMRVSLHVMFAGLLIFGIVRYHLELPTVPTDANNIAIAAAITLGIFYMIGTAWENRFARGDDIPDPGILSPVWLVIIVALWAFLVGASGYFLWLMFPLVFVMLHLKQGIRGILGVALLLAIAIAIPLATRPDEWMPAQAMGPTMGAAFSTVIFYSYTTLRNDAQHYRQLAAELLAAQQDLATSEHEAGRLEERERLSREIHDTVTQSLSSIVILARAAHGRLDKGEIEDVARQLSVIEAQASDSLAEARRFVRDLAAPALGDSLPIALTTTVNNLRAKQDALGAPLDVHLELVGDTSISLPEPVSRTVVRVTQEGLNNVVKHAHATKAVVTLGVWEDEVSLDVVDNGVGFNPDTTERGTSSGFGLDGLRTRVNTVGGTLVIESDTCGTALACRIPLTSRRETS